MCVRSKSYTLSFFFSFSFWQPLNMDFVAIKLSFGPPTPPPHRLLTNIDTYKKTDKHAQIRTVPLLNRPDGVSVLVSGPRRLEANLL